MMEKQASPDRTRAMTGSRTGPVLSVVAALVGPVCVIFLTGYLTIQLQLSEAGAPLLNFDSQPVFADGWSPSPYLIRAALVLLALAAVLGYRWAVRTDTARLLTLVVLVVAVFAGAYALRPIPNDGEPHPLGLYSLINGAISPFTLALIGAVIADLIARRQRRPATTHQRPARAQ
jgi:hypothetical protein